MSPTAHDEIVDIYQDSFREIYACCAFRLFRKDYAEDAAATVFLNLVERYAELRQKDRAEIRNWLYGTARNVISAYLRDRKRHREIVQSVAAAKRAHSDQKSDENRLDWPVLYEAVSKLKPQHQEIVALRFFKGMETHAIAQAMGVRHVTVRVQLSRIMKRLKRELGKSFGVLG